MNEEDFKTEEYAIISPIHLSDTRVLFEYKRKSLIELAASKFNSARIRLLSQHTQEYGMSIRYLVEIFGN